MDNKIHPDSRVGKYLLLLVYRNKKWMEIEQFDWFIILMDTSTFGFWFQVKRTLRWKNSHARELSRNQAILRFDVIPQHNWPIKQCLLHIRVFFGMKTKSPCFDLFIHWLIKQIMNTYRNHFSRSYENRSNNNCTECVSFLTFKKLYDL